MARKAEEVGAAKAALGTETLFALGVLAGAFITMGAAFATTVTAGGAELPYGVVRLLAGLAFSLGLVLVVVAGAELFTGNNLVVMAWASGKVTSRRLLWTVAMGPDDDHRRVSDASHLETHRYGQGARLPQGRKGPSLGPS
jgi:formate/nitrite transporter FocA (FNT family)